MTEKSIDYPVVMPKLGLTMIEATLVEWLKEDGARVEKGEPLFVLETEKSSLEIEAPASGVLHILVPAGETVPVKTPIARLVRESGTGHQEAAPDTEYAIRNTSHASRLTPASPKARALARRLDVPLADLTGTGPRGMIVSTDVQRASASQPVTPASPVARRVAASAGLDLSAIAGTGPGGRIMRADVERARAESEPARATTPLTGLRAIVAERMSASWRERPHVTLTTEADATDLVSARRQVLAELGQKVAYDAFLVALVARALSEHPHVNARLTADGIERLDAIHVGVAVDTERGLLVPVVRDAASKGLLEIQAELVALAERARAGRSLPDDLAGGTFTITNLGMFEIDAFTPIINPPESAILGVGRIVARPVVVDRQVVVRDMMALSLSFDHRLIDGAPAARFLQRVKKLIERPFALALGWREG